MNDKITCLCKKTVVYTKMLTPTDQEEEEEEEEEEERRKQ
jgi:hypothetical protein